MAIYGVGPDDRPRGDPSEFLKDILLIMDILRSADEQDFGRILIALSDTRKAAIRCGWNPGAIDAPIW